MSLLIRGGIAFFVWLLLSLAAIWLPAWLLWNNLIAPILGLPMLNLIECIGLVIFAGLAAKGAANLNIEFGPKS